MTVSADPRTVASPSPPSTPRLLLDRTGARYTLLDGAWWPRSTDPVAELPGLVLAIDSLHDPVTRLILNVHDWDSRPRRLAVAGRVVRVGYFASQPMSLLTAICGLNRGRVDLMIVPPGTAAEVADAAMLIAATGGNQVHAQDIIRTVVSSRAEVSDREGAWETEGGHLAGSWRARHQN